MGLSLISTKISGCMPFYKDVILWSRPALPSAIMVLGVQLMFYEPSNQASLVKTLIPLVHYPYKPINTIQTLIRQFSHRKAQEQSYYTRDKGGASNATMWGVKFTTFASHVKMECRARVDVDYGEAEPNVSQAIRVTTSQDTRASTSDRVPHDFEIQCYI